MRLQATGLNKWFGPVVALSDVDFSVDAGRVHAVVGENGAGKSTLAKVIAGVVEPDAGSIEIEGRSVRFHDRRGSIAAGVGYVPQALSLVGALTLVENHRLGARLDATGPAANRAARAQLAYAAAEIGVDIPLDAPTARLSLAERQLGELLIAIAQGAHTLLLDEPTSTLGPFEIERLMSCVRRLADDGTAIVLVTHRIGEVLGTSDEVTVLRAGHRVHHGPTAGLDANSIAEMMVGHRPASTGRIERTRGISRLVVTDLQVANDAGAPLEDVDLDVVGGEIVGVAGVAGSGQRLLAEALVGLLAPRSGRVAVDGVVITGDARRAAAMGMSYVPEERVEGLVAVRPIAENASLLGVGDERRTRQGMRRRGVERSWARRVCERFGVRPPRPELPATALSGGNQQKLLIGRELLNTVDRVAKVPSVVVAHGPTQGLDLAAAAAVRQELHEVAAAGSAVVIISADLDELLTLSDRIVVLAGGRVADIFDVGADEGHEVDVVRIGRAMAGISDRA